MEKFRNREVLKLKSFETEMSHSVYIYVMCFDQVVETGVSCHVCAGEEVSGNLFFKNVSRGNANLT